MCFYLYIIKDARYFVIDCVWARLDFTDWSFKFAFVLYLLHFQAQHSETIAFTNKILKFVMALSIIPKNYMEINNTS